MCSAGEYVKGGSNLSSAGEYVQQIIPRQSVFLRTAEKYLSWGESIPKLMEILLFLQ